MLNRKEKKNNRKKTLHPHIALKKFAIAASAFATLTFGTISVGANDDGAISTVYHVYIKGERVGIVDSKDIIDKAVDKKIDQIEKEYQGLELTADGLTYIAEKTFRPNPDNEKIAASIASKVDIVTEAAALVVNGEPVTYLASPEDVENVIQQLKLKYISAEALQEVESRKLANTETPQLKEGESLIVDVLLTANVTSVAKNISPASILTVDEAVRLLQKGTLEEKKYAVKEGDVLGGIAIAHNLSTKELLSLNPGLTEDSLIKIGQELNVTALKSFVDVIIEEKQVTKEMIPFQNETIENSEMFKGDKKIKQEGQDGEKIVNYTVQKVNGQVSKREVIEEKIIKEPINQIVLQGTKVVPSRGTGQLAWPTAGGYISSNYGYRWGSLHKGIDIARPNNRTIIAPDNGTVVSAGRDGGYGYKIVINHNNGFRTVYAHLASLSVKAGQTVSKGQKIAVMGTTGNSTGVHLHFEVYKNGKLQNPLDFLN